jgi:hypothetical protein
MPAPHAPSFRYLQVANEEQFSLSRFLEDSVYYVLGTDGRPLMRVRVPLRLSLLSLSGDQVWALARDSAGIPMVLKYRVRLGSGRGYGAEVVTRGAGRAGGELGANTA